MKMKSLSCVWLFATPWTAAYKAPPSMGFSRQEYWSGLPSPSPSNYLGNSYPPHLCTKSEIKTLITSQSGQGQACAGAGSYWLSSLSLQSIILHGPPQYPFPNPSQPHLYYSKSQQTFAGCSLCLSTYHSETAIISIIQLGKLRLRAFFFLLTFY